MQGRFPKWFAVPAFAGLVLLSTNAVAAINNAGVLDNVLARYQAQANTWGATVLAHATFLFWALATISMVWTMGIMILRRADLGEFYAEFIRFILFTGLFWWLLSNGPAMAVSLINSLRQIGGEATGLGPNLSPSGIVDIGFDIFYRVLDQSSVWSPIDSATGLLISAVILVIMALIGVNMLLLLIGAWILAYAGIFFLGFGGSRWTSDIAVGYFKTVLSLAGQLFAMVLLIGIGRSFVDQYYAAMSIGLSLKELAVMLIVALVLLLLVQRIPPMMGQLAFGGTSGSLGNFGTGAAMGAAAMGAAAVASAGAAIAAAVTSVAGGSSAVMAAVQKASQNVASGSDILSGMGGGSSSGTADGAISLGGGGGASGGGGTGPTPLGAAMGDANSGNTGSSGSTQQASAGPASGSANGFSIDTPQGASADVGGGLSSAHSDTAATSAGSDKVSGEVNPGRLSTAGRIVADAAANLAQGSWAVAKDAAQQRVDSAKDRIAETTGGKIAAAIRGEESAPSAQSSGALSDTSSKASGAVGGLTANFRAAGRMSDDSAIGAVSEFGNNSLGRRPDKAELAAEVAAFRDSKNA
jgi:type IV secretion system protein TrbL